MLSTWIRCTGNLGQGQLRHSINPACTEIPTDRCLQLCRLSGLLRFLPMLNAVDVSGSLAAYLLPAAQRPRPLAPLGLDFLRPPRWIQQTQNLQVFSLERNVSVLFRRSVGTLCSKSTQCLNNRHASQGWLNDSIKLTSFGS